MMSAPPKGFRILAALVLTAALAAVSGCVSTQPRFFVRTDSDAAAVRKLAVLPFENFSTDETAGEKLRRVVIADLLSRNIDVLEPGEITKYFADNQVRLTRLTGEDFRKMSSDLGVDGVIMGSVEAYRISAGLTMSYPEVSVQLRLLDGKSGAIVWALAHTSGGPGFWTRHFGVEHPTVSDTAKRVVQEAFDTLF